MSAADWDERVVAGLRAAMKAGKVTMRALSERTGIPYRSLQNYMSGTKMPAGVYVQICEELGVDNQFVLEGHFQLRYHPLWDALFTVLGDGLLKARFEPIPEEFDEARHRERQRRADALARLLSNAYDRERLDHLRRSHGLKPLTVSEFDDVRFGKGSQ